MSATTTNLKAQVQARIDAASAATTLRDLMILRKSAQGLGCNESNLDTLVTSKLNAMSAGTAHIDLIIGNQASDINTTKATPLGTYVGVPITSEPKFTVNNMTFISEGYFETADFDPALLPLSYRTYGSVTSLSVSLGASSGATPTLHSCDFGSSNRGILHFKGTGGGTRVVDNPESLATTAINALATSPALAANDAIFKWLTGTTWLCRTLGTLHISTDDGATWTDISSRIATIGAIGLPAIASNGAGVVLTNTGSAEGILARSINNAGAFSGTTITLPGTTPICHGLLFINATTCIAYGSYSISSNIRPVIWVSTNSGASFGSPVEVRNDVTTPATYADYNPIENILYVQTSNGIRKTANFSTFVSGSGRAVTGRHTFGFTQDGLLASMNGDNTNGVSVGVQGFNGVPSASRKGIIARNRTVLCFDSNTSVNRLKTGVCVLKNAGDSGDFVAMRIK